MMVSRPARVQWLEEPLLGSHAAGDSVGVRARTDRHTLGPPRVAGGSNCTTSWARATFG